jgi:hypothetical protein
MEHLVVERPSAESLAVVEAESRHTALRVDESHLRVGVDNSVRARGWFAVRRADKPHLWVVGVDNSLKARGWFAVRMWSAVRNKFGGSCQAGSR